ncbi:FAD-binding domain-containing protein [Fomitiporia mediterranea MF3/22]|uniref:FAD-binding domain-containing protein n=1 Tax=Fomitiporia mediterranea (strain MF3/22) TaxID=694068 RepID=UPI00044076AC|nr:FAD-binding domain-containing protein [Fomitiporia mediterranea MF3/22]EJD01924.1 FAD-binding domain-containing protein [Fomitiporia mediterranea MF3/22]
MAATFRALKLFLLTPALLNAVVGVASSSVLSRAPSFNSVCDDIAGAVSNASDVSYPPELSYTSGISHWASSSSQFSACSVEPGSAEDVGKILQIVAKNRTPFAVKGGGHTANPGFSSTEGVHITMKRFNSVVYNADSGTADVGAGLLWDDVYGALEQHGVSVLGGRVSGVGVAGFTLGGGYSWKSNQFGLTIDSVQGYELVLPNGTVTTVTSDDDDLFFGLKVGFNNFGIVTKFTFKTYPQTQVWGGLMVFTGDQFNRLSAAVSKFAETVTDPKAALIAEFNALAGLPGATLNLFYDAPDQPDGIFDDFLNTPHVSKDVSTRSLLSLVQATPSDATSGQRGAFHTVSVQNYTSSLLDVILDQVKSVGANITSVLSSGTFISYDVEPFLPSLFTHGSPSAYPPSRSSALYPLNLYYAWDFPTSDSYFHTAIQQSAQVIEAAAVAEGQNVGDAALYGNYAVAGTPLERIYGDNLPRLEQIKASVDPEDVMSLAGGWKFSAS